MRDDDFMRWLDHAAAGIADQEAINLHTEGEDEEEELQAVPEAEKQLDPLYRAQIKRCIAGQMFAGEVEDVKIGMRSAERLYRVKYEDGDLEDMTADEVEEFLVSCRSCLFPPRG